MNTLTAALLVMLFVWCAVLSAHALSLGRLVREIARQLQVHGALLSGDRPEVVDEAAIVQGWLEQYQSEPAGSPKHQALAARLRARGVPID